MKNLKHVVAITILAGAVLFGCQKETNDPILQNKPNEVSFKGPGGGGSGAVDTIYIRWFNVGGIGQNSGGTNPFGWPNHMGYAGEGASISIIDQNGNYIQGVNVTGQFTGCFSSTMTKKTNSSGGVDFIISKTAPSACTSTFTVMSVVKSGYYYDATKNIATSSSKVYP